MITVTPKQLMLYFKVFENGTRFLENMEGSYPETKKLLNNLENEPNVREKLTALSELLGEPIDIEKLNNARAELDFKKHDNVKDIGILKITTNPYVKKIAKLYYGGWKKQGTVNELYQEYIKNPAEPLVGKATALYNELSFKNIGISELAANVALFMMTGDLKEVLKKDVITKNQEQPSKSRFAERLEKLREEQSAKMRPNGANLTNNSIDQQNRPF